MTVPTVAPAAMAPKQAAAYCGFSVPTFWRLQRNDASFPRAFRVSPGRCAVLRSELDQWLVAKREAVQ